MVRLPFIGIVKIFSRVDNKAKVVEREIHETFDLVRFNQSTTRTILKAVCKLIFVGFIYYGFTEYPEIINNNGKFQGAFWGIVFAYYSLFWAEIKVGISRNSDNRLSQIRDDIKSGYTEWFRLPWPLIPVIIFASAFWVSRKTGITIGVIMTSALYWGIWEFLKWYGLVDMLV